MDLPATEKDQRRTLPTDTEQLFFTSFFADMEEEVYPHLTPEEAEDIFIAAYSELPTQPLPKTPRQHAAERRVLLCMLLLFFSFVGGAAIGIVTNPAVTVNIVPVTRSITLTAQLAVPTRTLAPVTLSQSSTTPTTGLRHQDATQARGTLTLYNGRFAPQAIPGGTVFVGRDGVEVSTDQAVSIPAAQPPQVGVATVAAHALRAGGQGNIAANDIALAVSSDLLVKNTSAFDGGRDARDYQAVAQRDLDSLSATLRNSLTKAMSQAFRLAPGEADVPTYCVYRINASDAVGNEAPAITEKATYTCGGIAYNRAELRRQATTVFTHQAAPGANYQLEGALQVSVTGISPFTISCSGVWVYVLSEDYEQFLAQKIAGDSPQQAQTYLLRTGFITRATVPERLPKDPGHIQFQVLTGV